MPELMQKTAEELKARQIVLEEEIQSNEEEAMAFQAELAQIYAEQDRRKA